ncbi:MAG: lipoate--protein ligase family protein [Candidatus Omnitrophica bacterium]|nr:lipoate--protein ligase family protein [Candidatus Omnitrophota bacterium]
MTFEDVSFPEPKANLEYDDALLRRADTGEIGESFRFWESPNLFVVLGRTSKEQDDVYVDLCQKDGIPILRRSSGGGTVLQGPGCLNFSLVLSKKDYPELQAIHASYKIILERIALALIEIGIDAQFRPVCDLVMGIEEKKFSGNAQRRGRSFILHHGTILYDFDLSLISKYLKIPQKMPDYRARRTHADFVTNIYRRPEDIKRVIQKSFLKAGEGL